MAGPSTQVSIKPGKRIVHEAEIQRQHPRYKIAAKCMINKKSCIVGDWSVSGMSVLGYPDEVRVGEILNVVVFFPLNQNVDVAMSVAAEVRSQSLPNQRIGLRFSEGSLRKSSLLKEIARSYLEGEMVPLDNVVQISLRNEETAKLVGTYSEGGRIGRYLGFGGLAAAVVALIAVIGGAAYKASFVESALSAKIVADAIELRSPTTGHVELMVSKPKVGVGSVVAGVKGATNRLSTLDSTCDCMVSPSDKKAEGSFVRRGEVLARLVKQDSPVSIVARVPIDVVSKLSGDGVASIEYLDGRVLRVPVSSLRPKVVSTNAGLAGLQTADVRLEVGRSDIGVDWDGQAVSLKLDTSPLPWLGKVLGAAS